MTPDYSSFLDSKSARADPRGLSAVPNLASHLFSFQRSVAEFALHVGHAGCFLDTGLGKTEIQLEFCQKAIEATNGAAILWTPLAVAGQTKRRAERWGYDAKVIREQSEAMPGIINICNYDRRDKIDPAFFPVVSCDEASILKSFTGATTKEMTAAHRGARFKLVATATPAPNDHMEIGNYADFLEVMAGNEMLSRFFINDTSTASQEWRLKGHAENAFWDWMASWARMAEKPSDITGKLGDDIGYDLPPLNVVRHSAEDQTSTMDFAAMFGAPKMSATSMYDIKRQTSAARARVAAEIVHKSLFGDAWQMTARTNSGVSATPKTPPIAKNAKRRRGAKTSFIEGQAGLNQPSELNCKTTVQCTTFKTDVAESAERERLEGRDHGSTSTIVIQPVLFEDFCAIPATSGLDSSKTIPKTSSVLLTTSESLTLPSWVLWCDTNDEQDHLERELGDLCISIRGSQSADEKEALHEAWLANARPVLITKPSIFGFGCDWPHCSKMIFVGRTFSYETWYQSVRRCWRFGQKHPVTAHLIVAEGDAAIGRTIDRKADGHAKMKAAMRDAMRRATSQSTIRRVAYNPNHITETPKWLRSAA